MISTAICVSRLLVISSWNLILSFLHQTDVLMLLNMYGVLMWWLTKKLGTKFLSQMFVTKIAASPWPLSITLPTLYSRILAYTKVVTQIKHLWFWRMWVLLLTLLVLKLLVHQICQPISMLFISMFNLMEKWQSIFLLTVLYLSVSMLRWILMLVVQRCWHGMIPCT